MTQFFTILSMVLNIIPQLLKAISAVEEQIDKGQSGSDKKEMVLSIIDIVAEESEVDTGVLPKIVKVISKVIDKFVSILNKVGVFKTNS